MKAHNPDTGQTYESWDELVSNETNGFVVVGTVERAGTVPVVVGPYGDRDEAQRAQRRLRNKWKRQEEQEHGANGGKVTVLVRHLWKDGTV